MKRNETKAQLTDAEKMARRVGAEGRGVMLRDIVDRLGRWQDRYRQIRAQLHPDEDTNDRTEYREYDEAYNAHLEKLHQLVDWMLS